MNASCMLHADLGAKISKFCANRRYILPILGARCWRGAGEVLERCLHACFRHASADLGAKRQILTGVAPRICQPRPSQPPPSLPQASSQPPPKPPSQPPPSLPPSLLPASSQPPPSILPASSQASPKPLPASSQAPPNLLPASSLVPGPWSLDPGPWSLVLPACPPACLLASACWLCLCRPACLPAFVRQGLGLGRRSREAYTMKQLDNTQYII